MDKSSSESYLDILDKERTPPNYAFSRNKKRRNEEAFPPELDSLKEEMKEMLMTLFAKQKEDFKEILPTLKEIKLVNANIENSIAFLTLQNEDLKKNIDILETQSKEDKKHIQLLEEKLEELQKIQRKCNIEIKNVPRKNREEKADLLDMVSKLANSVGSSFKTSDIKDIYRIRANKIEAKTTSVIIETNSTFIKNDIIKMSKQFNVRNKSKLCAKHLGFRTDEDTPIFISEHLTRYASRLYFLARGLAKSKEYKYCWTAYGKIYVRKTDNSPIINITNEAQVQHLYNLSTEK